MKRKMTGRHPRSKAVIPPVKPVRLRSIEQWMKDNRSQPSEGPSAQEMDDQMMEAFNEREDRLTDVMMANKTWGTQEGTSQFSTDRLTIWQDVVAEFLPAETSSQQSED